MSPLRKVFPGSTRGTNPFDMSPGTVVGAVVKVFPSIWAVVRLLSMTGTPPTPGVIVPAAVRASCADFKSTTPCGPARRLAGFAAPSAPKKFMSPCIAEPMLEKPCETLLNFAAD